MSKTILFSDIFVMERCVVSCLFSEINIFDNSDPHSYPGDKPNGFICNNNIATTILNDVFKYCPVISL